MTASTATSTTTAPPDQIDALLSQHISQTFDEDRVTQLQQRFADEHVVTVSGLCPPDVFEGIRREAFDVMDRFGTSHDLSFEITDNTPRRMTTVGQPIIRSEGPSIHQFYFAPALHSLVSRVVGEPVHTCPYAGEHYVVSRLRTSGDTHGWHWDDYTYGLILVLEAPHYSQGGFVQAVPHTSWDKDDPDVYGALLKSHVRSYALEAGDAYIIKTNTTMHRVHEIRGDGQRTIINMTLASDGDLEKEMTHETNDVLFGGTTDPRDRA